MVVIVLLGGGQRPGLGVPFRLQRRRHQAVVLVDAQIAPLGRIGDDEDLKGVTVLFASDAGKHITGQTLAVDGGVSAV